MGVAFYNIDRRCLNEKAVQKALNKARKEAKKARKQAELAASQHQVADTSDADAILALAEVRGCRELGLAEVSLWVFLSDHRMLQLDSINNRLPSLPMPWPSSVQCKKRFFQQSR
jgi:hypothetical protein